MDDPKGKALVVVRDKAWDHVTRRMEENGKNLLVCDFCGLVIRGGGINRVKKHLAGRRGEIAPCLQVDPEVRVAIEASLTETDRKRKDKRKVQKDVTRSQIIDIIAEEMPGVLDQNMEKIFKRIEERYGLEKLEKQVNVGDKKKGKKANTFNTVPSMEELAEYTGQS